MASTPASAQARASSGVVTGREHRHAGRARQLDDLAGVAERGADDARAGRERRLDQRGRRVGGRRRRRSGRQPELVAEGREHRLHPGVVGVAADVGRHLDVDAHGAVGQLHGPAHGVVHGAGRHAGEAEAAEAAGAS